MDAQRRSAAICVPIGFENGQLSDREMTAAMTMRERGGRREDFGVSAPNPKLLSEVVKMKSIGQTNNRHATGLVPLFRLNHQQGCKF